MIVNEGHRLPKVLLLLAGLALIVNHALQLFRVAVAILGMTLRPFDPAKLEAQGIAQWTIYYGSVSGLVEGITLIAFGVMLLKQSMWARGVLVWLLAAFIAHDVAYAALLGTPFADVALYLGLNAFAWIALLACGNRQQITRA